MARPVLNQIFNYQDFSSGFHKQSIQQATIVAKVGPVYKNAFHQPSKNKKIKFVKTRHSKYMKI